MLVITLAAAIGGSVAISAAMLAGSGWQTPGTYTGISNAAHPPSSTTHCYAFQTGCKNTNDGSYSPNTMENGAYLSGKS